MSKNTAVAMAMVFVRDGLVHGRLRKSLCSMSLVFYWGSVMRTLPFLLLVLLALAAPANLIADMIAIDFEGLPDSTILTNQYPGVTFSNAIILSTGISLNEFEFPPHSGTKVASDSGAPMSITFLTPVQDFGGYFTYTEPLTLDAFGIGNTLLASVTSSFSNNEALSGVAGSSPNELLRVRSLSGISRVTITGDSAGGSFTVDDANYSGTSAAVPEPSGFSLLLLGGAMVLLIRRRPAVGRS